MVCKNNYVFIIFIVFIFCGNCLRAMEYECASSRRPRITKVFLGLHGVLVDRDATRTESLLMTFSRQEWDLLHQKIKKSVSKRLHSFENSRLSWIMSRLSIIVGALLNQTVARLVRERVSFFVDQHPRIYKEQNLGVYDDELCRFLYVDGVIEQELRSLLNSDQDIRATLQVIVNTTGGDSEDLRNFIIKKIKKHGINVLARKRFWLPVHTGMLQYVAALSASGFVLARQLAMLGIELFLVTDVDKTVIKAYTNKAVVRDALNFFDQAHLVNLNDLRSVSSCGECVLIDVNATFLQTAQRLGMQAIDFRMPFEQVLNQLQSLGVLKKFDVEAVNERVTFEIVRIRCCSWW